MAAPIIDQKILQLLVGPPPSQKDHKSLETTRPEPSSQDELGLRLYLEGSKYPNIRASGTEKHSNCSVPS